MITEDNINFNVILSYHLHVETHIRLLHRISKPINSLCSFYAWDFILNGIIYLYRAKISIAEVCVGVKVMFVAFNSVKHSCVCNTLNRR